MPESAAFPPVLFRLVMGGGLSVVEFVTGRAGPTFGERAGPCRAREVRRGWPGGISVLVDESATPGRFQNSKVPARWLSGSAGSGSRWSSERWGRCWQAQAFKLAAVPGDGAVGEFVAKDLGSDVVASACP